MSRKSRIVAILGSSLMVASLIGVTAAPVAARHSDPTLFDVISAQDRSEALDPRPSVFRWKAKRAIKTLHQVRVFRDHGTFPPWLRRAGCQSDATALVRAIIRDNLATLRYSRGQVNGWQFALRPNRARILSRAAMRAAERNYHSANDAFEDCVEGVFVPRRFGPFLP